MAMSAVEITLMQPLIASFDVATAAAATSLDYLPGAMLWGALVSDAYRSGQSSTAILDAFYGGGLVIDDALPVDQGTVALPAPRSLHRPKGARPAEGYVWKDWSDGGHEAGNTQAKQGAFGPTKPDRPLQVAMTDSQRTAIDPTTKRAADGQFFGLQAIAEGQRFIATLSGPPDLVKRSIAALTGAKYLGRSRNVEFGHVVIKPTDLPRLPDPGTGKARYIWCLSDLAAHDDCYLPTERPSDTFFGAAIAWSHSFVRHRMYAPFNATWKTRQSERLVIARGSVIVLQAGIDAGQNRFGFYQEQGLGRVFVSETPPLALLTAWQAVETGQKQPQAQDSTDALVTWLHRKAKAKTARTELIAENQTAWTKWKNHYAAAATLSGERCGPTPSQWGALVGMTDVAIMDALTKASDPEKENERQSWLAHFAAGDRGTFAAEALTVIGQGNNCDALRRLAHTLRAHLIEEKWFDGK